MGVLRQPPCATVCALPSGLSHRSALRDDAGFSRPLTIRVREVNWLWGTFKALPPPRPFRRCRAALGLFGNCTAGLPFSFVLAKETLGFPFRLVHRKLWAAADFLLWFLRLPSEQLTFIQFPPRPTCCTGRTEVHYLPSSHCGGCVPSPHFTEKDAEETRKRPRLLEGCTDPTA